MSKRGKIFFFAFVVSLACFAIIFSILGTWIPFLWFPLVFSLVSLPAWLYYDKELLIDFFAMRTTKSGISMGSMILLVLVVLALVNIIGARKYKSFDFSIAKANSLSAQSKSIVTNLKSPLSIYFFYKPGVEGSEQNRLTLRRLVALYQDVSTNVKFEIFDVNEHPQMAQDFKVTTGRGEAFVVYQERNNKVDRLEEQDLTNAIIKTMKEKKPVLYFTEGHGEKSIKDSGSEMSAYALAQLLEKNSYTVKPLSFLEAAEVPEDASMVIALGPSRDLQSFEVKALSHYLARGGQMILAFDPEKPAVWKEVQELIGLKFNRHYVFNLVNTPYGTGVDQRVPTVGSVFSEQVAITKVFKNNEMTSFAFVGSFERIAKEGFHYEDMVKTNPQSVSLASLESKAPEGPAREFSLAAAITGEVTKDQAKKFEVIAFADSDFVSSVMLGQNLNRDLFMNTVAYLVKDTDLISVSPKDPSVTLMKMTQATSVGFFVLFMTLSLALLLSSLILYFRRKNA